MTENPKGGGKSGARRKRETNRLFLKGYMSSFANFTGGTKLFNLSWMYSNIVNYVLIIHNREIV